MAESSSTPRPVHCWEPGDSSTCLLLDEHDGPHNFTPDTDFVVVFDHLPDEASDA